MTVHPMIHTTGSPTFLGRLRGTFVDGVACEGSGDEDVPITNPFTGDELGRIRASDASDVDRAVSASRRAFAAWRRRTPAERAEVLRNVANVIRLNSAELRRIESLNTGKPKQVAEDDLLGSADCFDFMAGTARSAVGGGAAEYVTDRLSVFVREPLGVVAAILPWNYPLMMASWKLAAALAAGNTIVLKPSQETPLSLLRLMELCIDIIPAGVVNVVTGPGRLVGTALARHPDVDVIAITGGIEAGKSVHGDASDSLKRVHLELGGKAPVMVFPDADLEAVAAAVRRAGFWNSGQECGAATRVIVHRDVHDELVSRLVSAVSTLTIGDDPDSETLEFGPLISRRHQSRVAGMVRRAIEDGAVTALGGYALDGAGYFYAPTVLTHVRSDTEIARDEVFGPVVTIERAEDDEDIVRLANGTRYGLVASVWTADGARSLRVSRDVDFGTVWVNDHLVVAAELPWGGFKESGHGTDMSVMGYEEFTRVKHIMLNQSSDQP